MNRELSIESPGAPPARFADWQGTDRYAVRRCIGTGGMGAVYEAFDRERGQAVAIKRLRFFSPAALYLFKQEFRTLEDVHHPNLVRLHELVATEARDVFFTMELVLGVDLVEHVLDQGKVDFDRLRAALRQLVEGVQALHAAGKLHRDIKPSNVLVTPEGRVVLLDFGVATDLSELIDESVRPEGPIVGTASYMAPEQASGAAPTPASDWYGVGAILFEAMVRGAPFVGSVGEVLRLKSAVDAPAPSGCAPNVPPDLDALCRALLRRAPDQRPTGPEILRRLGASREHASASPVPGPDPSGMGKLFGRTEHLSALRDAFNATRADRSVTVRIGGPPGAGKSALVQAFLDELASRGDAVVLRGRVHQRESVPYKAIDGWVDALSRLLLRLSDGGSPVALPADVWALARLFPVLRRVPEIADVREQALGDPHRVRRRAFGALRELLGSLAHRQPVVICVDDVHWGDADSAALLLDLVRPPQGWPLLLLMTYREDEAGTSPFLAETRVHWPQAAETRDLAVGPLGADEARNLALALLGTQDVTTQARAQAVARESGGSPFLVEELVRSHQNIAPPGGAAEAMTLEQSVGARVSRLSPGPRRLLEMIAVGGRPLPVATVADAAEVDTGVDDAIALLRACRFVRVGLRHGHEVVETTNDRIREAILAGLSDDLVRERHARLARVLQATPGADPETVAVHLFGSAQEELAGPYAQRAAEQAMTQLAFDRAVQLFRLALVATPAASTNSRGLRVRLAEALAAAGRGAEAARAYLNAAEGVFGLQRVDLERAAAEQLLACGRIDEGAVVLHRVLAAGGMRAPRSTLSALFWLVLYRLWGAVIGLRVRARGADAVRHEDRARIDALYAVAMGFAVVDVLLGACMQARHLILALRAGDGFQILRATSIEASQLASLGGRQGRRERGLVEVARRLATRSDSAEGKAFFEMTLGMMLFLRGRWSEAGVQLDLAAAMLPNARAYWETNGHLFRVHSLYFAGNVEELVTRQARMCADAVDRGDLYTTVNFATTTLIATHLAADDPEGARRQAREAMAQWSQSGFFVQQWQAMAFEPEIDLYVGDGGAAYDRLTRDLPALRRSLLLNVQFIRALTLYVRGRCAIGSIDSDPVGRRERVAEARAMSRRLAREGMPWTAPLSAMVKAAAENAAGKRAAAVAALRAAIDRAQLAGMSMHATAARHRLGELLGGEEGQKLMEIALQALRVQGIRDPSRWLAVFLPGRWGDRSV
jgi:eukaryotic-like serine/threonine-protein kinase